MKYLAAAAFALTLSSGTFAVAGNLSDPILHQDLIIEDAKAGSSSSGTTMVAMMALLAFRGGYEATDQNSTTTNCKKGGLEYQRPPFLCHLS